VLAWPGLVICGVAAARVAARADAGPGWNWARLTGGVRGGAVAPRGGPQVPRTPFTTPIGPCSDVPFAELRFAEPLPGNRSSSLPPGRSDSGTVTLVPPCCGAPFRRGRRSVAWSISSAVWSSVPSRGSPPVCRPPVKAAGLLHFYYLRVRRRAGCEPRKNPPLPAVRCATLRRRPGRPAGGAQASSARRVAGLSAQWPGGSTEAFARPSSSRFVQVPVDHPRHCALGLD
jgi:hypothetical protein